MRGRPLAFLVLVVAGWGTGRFLALAPEDVVRPLTLASRGVIAPAAAAETLIVPVIPQRPVVTVKPRPRLTAPSAMRWPRAHHAIPGTSQATSIVVAPSVIAKALGVPALLPVSTNPAPAGLPPTRAAERQTNRWSGSAWAIVRNGGGAGGALLSPLLGGSQAGIRIAYRLDDAGRTALFARAATPLKDGPAELAGGVQWRPTRVPVTVYAEVRATRGQAAPAVGAFGGGAVALAASFRLEGYGQVGVISRDGVSGFGDAQVRLQRPLGPIEIGAGAWAAAQRGAARLDVGPSLGLPIAAAPLALRISLDWRHRIAGNARPASGAVLSLGADF